MLAIRPFCEADLPAVVDLWNRVFGYAEARNDPAEVIAEHARHPSGTLLIAERDGGLVGTLMSAYDGHRGWFYRLAVDEPARRFGIATQLVMAGEASLKKRGCRKINLQLHLGNERGVAFWQAVGFGVEARVSMGKDLGEDADHGVDAGC